MRVTDNFPVRVADEEVVIMIIAPMTEVQPHVLTER